MKKAKVITCLGNLYDLPDPYQFLADVAKALAHDGVFVAQLMMLDDMVAMSDVGNLANEHLEFYSFRSLELLLARCGLEIFDLETVPVNGQSTRLWIRHISGTFQEDAWVRMANRREKERGYHTPEFYTPWWQKLERNRILCCSLLQEEVGEGKRVCLLGASTKGNVIAQYYNLTTSLIRCAEEISPEKFGKVLVGSGIPICTEEQVASYKPDVYLVLPYGFKQNFIKRKADWLGKGGRLLFPLPEPHYVECAGTWQIGVVL